MSSYADIERLLKERPHTSDELIEKTGRAIIARRIQDMRQDGFEISMTLIPAVNKGLRKNIGQYALIKSPSNREQA